MKERKSNGKAEKEKPMLEELLDGMAPGNLLEDLMAEYQIPEDAIVDDNEMIT